MIRRFEAETGRTYLFIPTFSELIEGAAVIESQSISDTRDKRDRWVGCGRDGWTF
jgi:hypothetical protein